MDEGLTCKANHGVLETCIAEAGRIHGINATAVMCMFTQNDRYNDHYDYENDHSDDHLNNRNDHYNDHCETH
jgi:hypothetical protein